jgi:uroporphyrinogen III methyltransferase/synthase
VRGAQCLHDADVVIYDALASEELLDLAPPHAERINVGKRGHDVPTRTQQETVEFMLDRARAGKCVVRLKGGDPFVFGRGGEEASACVEAGIPFEVIPGISAVIGVPAYAGIPVTDRRHAASFAVVTGHKDPTKASAEIRWDLLGQAVDTLVILMGMQNLEQIVDRILASGRSPRTPAAVIMNGTLPSQRTVVAPLGELVAKVQEAGLKAPATVVIGEAVELHTSLDWFAKRPLFGRRVLVTRAADQAGPLVAALRQAGAQPVMASMIQLVPPHDWAEVDAALDRLDDYDLLLLTSANAARFFGDRARARGNTLEGIRATVVCVGPATAEAAMRLSLPVHGIPVERFDAEGLLDELERRGVPAGSRILLPRSEQARETLPEGLRARGCAVDTVTAYRNVAPDIDTEALRRQLAASELHALTFTSPSTVANFSAMLDDAARAEAGRCAIAAIGGVTADALRKNGLPPNVVPETPGAESLVAALIEYFAAQGLSSTEGES